MVPGEAAYTGLLRTLDALRGSSRGAGSFWAEQWSSLSRLQEALEEERQRLEAEERRLVSARQSWEQQTEEERRTACAREEARLAQAAMWDAQQSAWEAERARLEEELREARGVAQRVVDQTELSARISQLEQERITLLADRRCAREQAEQLAQLNAKLAATQAALCTVQEKSAGERVGFETQQAQWEQERSAAEKRSADELAALQAAWDGRLSEEAERRRALEAQLAAMRALAPVAQADTDDAAERQALEAELEEVRRRAAELAESVQAERVRMAGEREAWEQELRELRQLVEAPRALREVAAPTGGVPASAGHALASTGSHAADHAVLDHVMAQFESLQRDRQRRRGNQRGGKQEVA